MKSVVVREYARLTTDPVEATLDQATITPSAFEWLCNLSASFSKYGASLLKLENTHWLRLDNYVGVVEGGRLSKDEAEFVLTSIAGISGPLYSGGDGYSSDDPVVINCSITSVGINAERRWLTDSFGTEGTHWKLKFRSHGYRPNGQAFETFVLQFPDREDVSIHFDISQWYLKN